MRNLSISIVIVFLVFTANHCKNKSSEPEPEIVVTEPKIVTEIPQLEHNVYYFVNTSGSNAEKLENGPEPILQELIDNNFALEQAWYPTYPTPCMAMSAVEALIVQLEKHDERIYDFGFISNPENWIINCGIKSFYHYDFNINGVRH